MVLEGLERTEDCAIAIWDRLVLVRWRVNVTARGLARAHERVATLVEARGGAVLFSIVPPECSGPPSPEAQRAVREATATLVAGLQGVGIVFEGSGFLAAAIRALTLRLGGGAQASGGRVQVFRTLEDAARWAEKRLGPPDLSLHALRDALQTLKG
jgi:hypothetical protein